jgi:hypothetical protein
MHTGLNLTQRHLFFFARNSNGGNYNRHKAGLL